MKFFKHFLKDLKKTGAVVPSSKFLTRKLVKSLQNELAEEKSGSFNILEVGAGTGSVTKEISKAMRADDRLDVIEIQKDFYKAIQKKYVQKNIFIHHVNFLNFIPELTYDFIFSSLPYENMDSETSKRIWNKKINLCSSSGYISYFKYLNFRRFRNNYEEKVVDRFICDKKIVVRNLPPAKLYTLQVDKQSRAFAEAIKA